MATRIPTQDAWIQHDHRDRHPRPSANRIYLFLLRLKLRIRYWWKKACNFFGFCPCGGRVNFTPNGRPVCIECARAYR